jgi:hypothetical protein
MCGCWEVDSSAEDVNNSVSNLLLKIEGGHSLQLIWRL